MLHIFDLLLDQFGKRQWWPGDTPLEVSVGAILTQNCSWRNVEKAIDNLKTHGMLDIEALYLIDEEKLAEIIKPSGFYNIKSNRLKAFVKVLAEEYDGRFEVLRKYETQELRAKLLGIKGIGPETADSILLYALEKPVFVIDAYTRRFIVNHRILDARMDLTYSGLQQFFMDHLPKDTYLYNEFHALIVRLCQSCCKRVALCAQCPLLDERETFADANEPA